MESLRRLCIQVSHHPPVCAAHAENDHFKYDLVSAPTTKFLGNSLEVYPHGEALAGGFIGWWAPLHASTRARMHTNTHMHADRRSPPEPRPTSLLVRRRAHAHHHGPLW